MSVMVTSELTPSDRKRRRTGMLERYESAGNQSLFRMLHLLVRVERETRRYLRDHCNDCQCASCAHEREVGTTQRLSMRDTVAHAARSVARLADEIKMGVISPEDFSWLSDEVAKQEARTAQESIDDLAIVNTTSKADS